MCFCFRLSICLLCAGVWAAVAGAEPLSPPEEMGSTQPGTAILEADQLSGSGSHKMEAQGNVQLRTQDQSIRADRLSYFQDTQEIEAQGSVVLTQRDGSVSGPSLNLNLDTGMGSMQQPDFYLVENGARGSAKVMDIRDKQHYTLRDTTYTTCPADDRDWLLRMTGLSIDRDRRIGTARNTWVEFMGMPILYTPWMDFALSGQRKSGFLSPVFGGTVRGGSELTLPFYWNIVTNRDATLAPRIMRKRGLLLNNEMRYLEPRFAGEMHVDVLPNDKLTQNTRTHYALKHQQKLGSAFDFYANLNRVSDDAYFRDLGNTVNATSQVNLLREGGVSYRMHDWLATARVQRFQTLQDPAAPIIPPYARLPQLTLSTQQMRGGVNWMFAGEYVDFSHQALLSGRRLVLFPSVSYALENDVGVYLVPKVGLHDTRYQMRATTTTPAFDAVRTLPVLSLDSGLTLERNVRLFGGDYTQTLEPRLFYVYIPYRNQAALPNFDSAQSDFSFAQMFTENRFFGSDRVGDANQLTVAATSRWLDQESGAERLKMAVGERFSFSSPQVNLITPATSSNKSDILLTAVGQMTHAWSLDSEYQFDPNQSHTQRYNLAAHYRPEPGKVLNFGYRFTRNTLRQGDVSMQWPLFARWHALAKWNYSLRDARLLEAIVGLEYNRDCWTLRLVAQRFATATQQSNTSLFVQLELNELLKMGSDPLAVLKQSVPGYTKLNDKPLGKTTLPATDTLKSTQ
jgi:LPS-assembly protein